MAGVEAPDGLDQTEVRHLVEVVAGDAPAVVATGDLAGHPHVEPDDLFLDAGARLLRRGLGLLQEPGGLGAAVRAHLAAVRGLRGSADGHAITVPDESDRVVL